MAKTDVQLDDVKKCCRFFAHKQSNQQPPKKTTDSIPWIKLRIRIQFILVFVLPGLPGCFFLEPLPK
ncbi:hypothetical protein NSQ19_11645 [Weizmannia sp. FSL W8-1119]|uniref:hypothetical protein n=1 Tax=Weizmannia sp. FSL W8-1119 TaxID=2954709 RepID=UPI0030FA484B